MDLVASDLNPTSLLRERATEQERGKRDAPAHAESDEGDGGGATEDASFTPYFDANCGPVWFGRGSDWYRVLTVTGDVYVRPPIR